VVIVPLVAALVAAYVYRQQLFGVDKPVKVGVAALLVVFGWSLAVNIGRLLQPQFDRRLAPGTSGVVGFVLRLGAMVVVTLVSLRLAGLHPGTLAAGAGFTAVVLGLAAQQTFGNVFAGVVLLSARPFRVGDRVRFNGFGMDVEGTVADQGLLYVTMHDGEDLVLVPNNTALTMSARPIREPAAVDMRARLPLGVDPEAVQRKVSESVTVPPLGPRTWRSRRSTATRSPSPSRPSPSIATRAAASRARCSTASPPSRAAAPRRRTPAGPPSYSSSAMRSAARPAPLPSTGRYEGSLAAASTIASASTCGLASWKSSQLRAP
jgi:small conductance mechanosensitive channel